MVSEAIPPALAVSQKAAPARARRLALLILAATLALYARPLLFPVALYDDWQILTQSWTWEGARAGLWVPQNEHAMPLGRLLTYALVRLAGRPTWVPYLATAVGPAALLAGLGLLYLFVRRELGHPFYALVATALFGVTAVYQQAVWWFAAAFSVLALDTTLLALLAAQRWRQTGRALYLDLAVAAAALAPAWFAIGVLAGPLCCLYLLTGTEERGTGSEGKPHTPLPPHSPFPLRHLNRTFSLLPLLGTALFLAVSLPRTAEAILHLPHYEGKTAVEAFNPGVGLGYTGRSVVDNLLLGAAGVWSLEVPVRYVVVLLAGLALALAWWWRQAPRGGLILLGLGFLGGSYLLIYSARAAWPYAMMTQPAMSRYHLLPQLGLALIVAGGLPGRDGRWFVLDRSGALTPPQARGLALLVGACLLVQLPHGLGVYPLGHSEQQAALREVEEMDARCRAHHIDAAAARAALPKLPVPEGGDLNGWGLLRGSPDPRPVTPEEARALLTGQKGP
jgi:hypothetical protein